MADELTKLWGGLSLSAEESKGVFVKKPTVRGLVSRGNSCLVGKLIVDRFVGKEIIKLYLIKGWRPSGSLSLKVLGENMFLIDFKHFWDKSRVLEGRPWVFEGNLFLMEEFDGITPPAEIEFEKVAF
jgi:hypothetical protein